MRSKQYFQCFKKKMLIKQLLCTEQTCSKCIVMHKSYDTLLKAAKVSSLLSSISDRYVTKLVEKDGKANRTAGNKCWKL